jgi:adenine-specific DNA-methyltransferase
MSTYEGRLELTWTNKDQRLLAHEDGSYEWVSPADYRVAEVRLLHDAASVGAVGATRAADNLLLRGDALNALTSLSRLPEFAKEYAAKVKLAYIDPPFNTQQSFLQYDDALEHSVWLTMMRDRLLQMKDLLSDDGSIWVHCDDSEMHRLRCVMDEVFGPTAFVATVVWQKRYSRDNRPAIGTVHDYILVYAPLGEKWKDHRNRLNRDSAKEYRNPNNDPRGDWRAIPMTAQGWRPNQMYEIIAPGGAVHTPPKGRCWSMVREKYDALLAEGRIYFGKDNNSQPNVIRYFDEDQGLVPWTWWPSDEVGHTDEAKKEILTLFPEHDAFDTPKPELLMQRIIGIASNPGEIVLDGFLGSGTAAAVAQKMGRRWVGCERSTETLKDFAVPRLTKVVEAEDPGGVTELVGWKGGGGFRILDVASSMFEADDGMVFLADWMTNGALAEATAAQLGFAYEDSPPFAGRKGRTRLAVVDGVVNESVARILVGALPEEQRIVICGTGIDTDARPVLRALRPGSTLRKIPAALLDEYRSGNQLSLEAPEEVAAPETNGAAPVADEPAVPAKA